MLGARPATSPGRSSARSARRPRRSSTSPTGRWSAGDQVGLSGLQKRYDEQLRGTPGVQVRLCRRRSRPAPSASPSPTPSTSPGARAGHASSRPSRSAGKPLTTTLDRELQELAEQTLAKTKPASALVAIRPSTGAVVAAANGPGTKDLSVATVGQAPPGSTFKVVSSLALLRAGLKPSSPVTCPTHRHRGRPSSSRTTATIPSGAERARSPCRRRWPSPATPRSSASAAS